MHKIHISATELKNNVASILNEVYFNGKVAVVERYGKPIAEVMPLVGEKRSTEDVEKALEVTFGILPDFPNVTKFRRPRRRKIPAL